MGKCLLHMAMALTWMGLIAANPDISFSALETLLNLDAKITVSSIRENSVPLYRKDLPHDHVAYWQIVINDKDFVIVSSGAKTGDHRLIHEGPLPTYTSQLDLHSHGRCVRYVLLAPDAGIMCEDKNGKVLATTHYQLLDMKKSDDDVTDNGNGGHFIGPEVKKEEGMPDSTLHVFVHSSLTKLRAEFEKRRKDCAREKVWIEEEEETASLHIEIGGTIKLPVTTGAMIIAEEGSTQDAVCEATGVCDGTDNKLISKDVHKMENGIRHIMFNIKSLKSDKIKSVSFRIEVKDKGQIIMRHYTTAQTLSRKRRQTTGYYYRRIPKEWLFPDYNQFTYGRCQVGCGPVAWVSVFGYYDRLAHSSSSYSYKYKRLYRSGYDGTTGSNNQVAPKYNDARTKNYIRKIKGILGTFCFGGQGATHPAHMQRVRSFFVARVTGGHVVTKGFLSLWGIYLSYYRNKAIGYIGKGYPTIIGWKNGGMFKQHYPIATMYRYRRQKKCIGVWKWKYCWWKTISRQFYLHMGWGGSGNGWKKAQAYMTAVAYA